VETVEERLSDVLLDGLVFAEDGTTLKLNCGGVNLGVGKHVREDLQSLRNVSLLDLGVENSGLTRSVGVDGGTEVLNLSLKLLHIALGRALEEHVLEEVGHTVVLSVLIASTGVDHDTDSSGVTALDLLGGHTQTIAQRRDRRLWVLGHRLSSGGEALEERCGGELAGTDFLYNRRVNSARRRQSNTK